MARRIGVFSVLAVLILVISWFVIGGDKGLPEPDTVAQRDQSTDISPTGAELGQPDEALVEHGRNLFTNDFATRNAALEAIRARGNIDMVPALVMAMRYREDARYEYISVLKDLTGDDAGTDWPAWMLWQESHPDVMPFAGFDLFKSDILATVDPGYRDFIYQGVAHNIRLEEAVWGGVRAGSNGIPPLNFSAQISADEATYLNDDDLVFGISIDGDTRAYPLRLMNWHEMFNDTIGGVDLALAYCTLCGSGILYETKLDGRAEPMIFGSSGLLYRSNKLMYDYATNSLWNQFTGRPVVGELTGSGIELKTRPVLITSWAAWSEKHPETTVLSLETGHTRDYSPGAIYADYFDSPDLMFPAQVKDGPQEAKDFVFGMTVPGAEKAWPLTLFEGGAVVNDTVGGHDVVLIGDAATRTVRAYEGGDLDFEFFEGNDELLAADNGSQWTLTEDQLTGPDGQALIRQPGHIAYWFAWTSFRSQAPVFEVE